MTRASCKTNKLACLLLSAGAALVLRSPLAWSEDKGFIEEQIEAFRKSDFNIKRADSNAPFVPLAFASTSRYGSAKVESDARGVEATYDVTNISQGAVIPFVLGSRDVVGIGEYVSFSHFRVEDGPVDNFDVTSIGVPMGWARQVNPEWQVMSFVMPLGHSNSFDNGGWTWQTLGGAFTRWTQNDEVWWAFGVYIDVGTDESFTLPYLGASWLINEQWTVSAILPWPSVIYTPSPDWLVRFGASPSSASWSITPEDGNATLNLDAFDFGVGVERKLSQLFWLSGEVGIGGLRNLRFSDPDIDEPDFDARSSWYANISLRLRPPKLR